MKIYHENVFIIRGYKDFEGDEDDHRVQLLQAIRHVAEYNDENNTIEFQFKPESEEFQHVRSWVKQNIQTRRSKIDAIVALPEAIENRTRQIQLKKKLFKEDCESLGNILAIDIGKLNSSEELSKTEENTKQEKLQREIEYQRLLQIKKEREDLIAATKTNIQSLAKTILSFKSEVDKVIKKKEEEYGSQYIIENPGFFASYMGWSTPWHYEYPPKATERLEKIVPIERVEFSCAVKSGRLVFRTAINKFVKDGDNFNTCAISNNAIKSIDYNKAVSEIVATNEETTKSTGEFIVNQMNLENGKFSVTYYSNKGQAAIAGVRVFVKPENIPQNQRLITYYNNQIKDYREDLIKVQKKLEGLEFALEEDNHRLKVLERIGGNAEQNEKLRYLISCIKNIGYKKKEFFIKYTPNFDSLPYIEEMLDWLQQEKNFKSLVAILLESFEEEKFRNVFKLSLINFKSLLGISEHLPVAKMYENWCKELKENREQVQTNQTPVAAMDALIKKNNIPIKFFETMNLLSIKLGLNWKSIYELLQYFSENDKKVVSKQKEIEDLYLFNLVEQFAFCKLKEIYTSEELCLRTIEQISGLLDFINDNIVQTFIAAYRKSKEDIAKHDYASCVSEMNKVLSSGRTMFEISDLIYSSLSTSGEFDGLPSNSLVSYILEKTDPQKENEVSYDGLSLLQEIAVTKMQPQTIPQHPTPVTIESEEHQVKLHGDNGSQVIFRITSTKNPQPLNNSINSKNHVRNKSG